MTLQQQTEATQLIKEIIDDLQDKERLTIWETTLLFNAKRILYTPNPN